MRDGPVGQCLCCIYPWFRLRLVVMGLIFMASPCSSRLVSSRLVSFVFRNRRAERRENRAEAEQSVLMKLRTSLSRATYASNI